MTSTALDANPPGRWPWPPKGVEVLAESGPADLSGHAGAQFGGQVVHVVPARAVPAGNMMNQVIIGGGNARSYRVLLPSGLPCSAS